MRRLSGVAVAAVLARAVVGLQAGGSQAVPDRSYSGKSGGLGSARYDAVAAAWSGVEVG